MKLYKILNLREDKRGGKYKNKQDKWDQTTEHCTALDVNKLQPYVKQIGSSHQIELYLTAEKTEYIGSETTKNGF